MLDGIDILIIEKIIKFLGIPKLWIVGADKFILFLLVTFIVTGIFEAKVKKHQMNLFGKNRGDF